MDHMIKNANSSTVIDPNNTNRRIYTLSGDPEHNYLMDFNDSIKLMNQPTFYRAIDTNGKIIDTPIFIDSLGYEFWGEYYIQVCRAEVGVLYWNRTKKSEKIRIAEIYREVI